MNLFGSKKRPQRRRRKTPSYLDKAALSESGKSLIDSLQGENPTLQAALAQHVTGVPIKASDITAKTPEEKFEAVVIAEAMKDISKDKDFMDDAKTAVLDRIASGRAGGRRRMQRGRDGEEYDGMGQFGYGGMPQDPLSMLDMVDAIKERIGGGSAIDKLANSTVLSDIVKTVIPLLMGGKGQQNQPPQIAPRSMVAVEVDGQIVEMTRQGYEIYKRQREQLLLQAGAKVAEPPPKRPPAPPNTGTTPPKEEVPATDVEQPLPDNTETEAPSIILPESVVQTLVRVAKRFEAGMKLPPEKFVSALYEESLTDTDSAVIFSALTNVADYDDALAKVSNFKSYPDLLPFITKLEANRPWATAVLAKVKELAEEN